MLANHLSQRTLVSVMRALRAHRTASHELEEPPDLGELMYENGFPDWFVTHARNQYNFDWSQILPAIRNTQFFFPHNYFGAPGSNITDRLYLSGEDAAEIGETLLQGLASLATTLPEGEAVE
jgi:hypothetical protein